MSGFEIAEIAIKAFGGLALFLYGMTSLGNNLEKVSSGKMTKVLESLTSNVFKSVILGAFVTAMVQSSSATTVIIVGLVNAGILKLSSAVGVIMGANIGTTVTGQILRLLELENNDNLGSILGFLKPSILAPFLAVVGIVMIMAIKKENGKTVGEIFVGIGILFTGMNLLSAAVEPLAELESFKRLFEIFTNPFLGILVGAVVTAIIQSSSLSVGLLQIVALKGALTFSGAFPIIMGQNIGTCITPILASIGAGKNAKRAAAIHLYFNLIGTTLFLAAVYIIQYTVGLPFWDESISVTGIANFHTFFNVVVTFSLVWFSKGLEKLAVMSIKDTKEDEEKNAYVEDFKQLDSRLLVSPSFAINQAQKTTVAMGKLALENFKNMRKLSEKYEAKLIETINTNEEIIDRMEDKLSSYLVEIGECEITDAENRKVTELFHLISEYERVGDYTINLVENITGLNKKQIIFSEHAKKEIRVISSAVEEIIEMAVKAVEDEDMNTAKMIEPLEQTIDYINETLKARHIERLKNGECVIESGVNFLDQLIHLERISDHCSNVGVYVLSSKDADVLNHHEFIDSLHSGENEEYIKLEKAYRAKFTI